MIIRHGVVLLCQRRRGDSHPLKWEFPGGKVEPGESPASALRRELAEELDIEATIGAEIERYEYAYGGRPPILLVFYRVEEFEGEPASLAFEQIRWEMVGRLVDYDFLEGDFDFVRRLATGAIL